MVKWKDRWRQNMIQLNCTDVDKHGYTERENNGWMGRRLYEWLQRESVMQHYTVLDRERERERERER